MKCASFKSPSQTKCWVWHLEVSGISSSQTVPTPKSTTLSLYLTFVQNLHLEMPPFSQQWHTRDQLLWSRQSHPWCLIYDPENRWKQRKSWGNELWLSNTALFHFGGKSSNITRKNSEKMWYRVMNQNWVHTASLSMRICQQSGCTNGSSACCSFCCFSMRWLYAFSCCSKFFSEVFCLIPIAGVICLSKEQESTYL